jgi:hypothetical protein
MRGWQCHHYNIKSNILDTSVQNIGLCDMIEVARLGYEQWR